MLTQFSRTELLLGKEAMEKLQNSRVAVFGIGGVGGYVCEALARSGVGAFDLIDDDKVCLTNLNRQIIATYKTIGKYKTDVMKERILDINPKADVRVHKCFFLPENADEFPYEDYDYMVDAVDTVTAKISLVMKAQEKHIPIISSMGAGNKLDGRKFKVAEIKGCVFGGTVESSDRGYVDQLPDALCMSAGCETQMHRAERYSGQCRICSIGGRSDHCR